MNNRKEITLPAWPSYDEDDISAVVRAMQSGKVNYWTGNETRTFEEEFAAYVGMPFAIALTNGSVALELAMYALGIGPGDEVIVPCKSFIASASSVVLRGARPVFADVDSRSQNMTLATINDAITDHTSAIILVHLAGWPCEMDDICDFARANNLKLIEDCAQAHGAKYRGRCVGSFGDAAAFSFCNDKIMNTGGEGGMLLLKDRPAWRRAWSYKDHGKDYAAVTGQTDNVSFNWVHHDFGTNWRMNEIQAAIGRQQLKKLPGWLSKRKHNAAILYSTLHDVTGLRVYQAPAHMEHAYYRFYAFVQKDRFAQGWNKKRIMEALVDIGVPCQEGSCSEIYREKAFIDAKLHPAERLPNAMQLAEASICFPVHPTLSDTNMQYMADSICAVLQQACKT